MVFEFLKLNKHVTDTEFDTIFPEDIKRKGHVHWTPVEIAREASEFLSEGPNARILDIGSGAGKFCLVASALTDAKYTGVELRENLFNVSRKLAKYHRLDNVEFIHANITDIDFKAYTGFYFFNSFYENLEKEQAIDDALELKMQNYNIYTRYVKEQLDGMPKGTRLATYWSSVKDIPGSYELQGKFANGLLEMWEKTS